MKGQIEAVILDMDGLVLDTERVSKNAWQRAAQEFGYTLKDSTYLACLGRPAGDHCPIMKADLGSAFPFEDVKTRRSQLVEEYFDEHGVPVKPGVRTFLEKLELIQIPVCIATSTTKDIALQRLTESGIVTLVTEVIGGDEVENGKPAPDIYLRAAKQLNVAPVDCLAFEDSEAGLFSALAAGMRVILVPDLQKPSATARELAVLTIASLENLLFSSVAETLLPFKTATGSRSQKEHQRDSRIR